MRWRQTVLWTAAAAWAFACGLGIASLWIDAPPPQQLTGYLNVAGVDARGPVRTVISVLLSTFLLPLLLAPALRRLTTGVAHWAAVAGACTLFAGLWAALLQPGDLILSAIVPLSACLLIMLARLLPGRFSRADVVLLPVALAVFLAFGTIAPALSIVARAFIGAASVLMVRIAASSLTSERYPARYFALAPLALPLQAPWLGWHLPFAGVIALAFAAASVAVAWRFPLPKWRAVLAWIVLPAVVIALPEMYAPLLTRAAPHADMFEDGHSLLPASEMLRGELPYRDIVPGHGLISDGLLDALAIRLGASDIGDVLTVHAAVGALFPVAIYFLGLAVTGSCEAAFVAVLFACSVIATGTPFIRPIDALHAIPWLRALPSVLSLAFAAAAVRARSTRHLMRAGGFAVLALLTSLDFGAYAVTAGLFASLRFSRTRRWSGIASWGAGVLLVAVPCAVFLAAFGILDDALRVTLFEVLPLGPAYAIGFFSLPEAFSSSANLPEAIGLLFHPRTVWIAGWVAATLATAAAFARAPLRSNRRTDPLLILGIWTAAAAISYAERLYSYYLPVLAVLAVAAVFVLLWRRPALRSAAALATLGLAVIAHPTERLASLRAGAVEAHDRVPISSVPNAAGAIFRIDNARHFEAARTYLATLAPEETFFDFANMPMLYFLLDKPSPVRQYEVPFMQPPELQREVIDRLRSDRSVVAAVVRFPNHGEISIDGIPNPARAPMVWKYLQADFEPAWEEDGVVIWRRRQAQNSL